MFHHVNWTWAPPGCKGNVCERCGSNCFCTAKLGLLPKTRSALAAANAAQMNAAAQMHAVQQAVVAPQDEQLDGIAAILQYDSDSD
jgi:hypothetical protein